MTPEANPLSAEDVAELVRLLESEWYGRVPVKLLKGAASALSTMSGRMKALEGEKRAQPSPPMPPEPSDSERAGWPHATEQYVAALEDAAARAWDFEQDWKRQRDKFLASEARAETAEARVKELEKENEALRLEMLGGEDAPGYAASLSMMQVVQSFREHQATLREQVHSAVDGAQVLWSGEHAEALDRAEAAELQLSKAEAERDELRQIFDLQWAADQRAIALWQALNPGNDLTWPDRTDLVVWLLGQLDAIEMAQVTGWPWPSEETLAELARLTGRDREGATQLAIDLGKTFGVPAGFAAHHLVADKALEVAQAQMKGMREALKLAAGQFRHYERLHRDKATPDGDAKAETNRGYADVCEAALQPQEGKA